MQADRGDSRYLPRRSFQTAAVLIGLCFLGVAGGCGSSSGVGGTAGVGGTGGGSAGGGGAGTGGAGAGGAAAGHGGTGGAIGGQGGSSGQGGGSAGTAGHGSGGGGGSAGAAGSGGATAGRTGTDGGVDAAAGRPGARDASVDSAVQSCLSSNPDPCACGRPDANALSATECAQETRCRAAGGSWEPYFVFLPDGGEHGPRCQTASGAPFDAGSG
jgi:hypothetical protein